MILKRLLEKLIKFSIKKHKKLHSMEITGDCDSGCDKDTNWFGNTSVATCNSLKCIEIQDDVYNSYTSS